MIFLCFSGKDRLTIVQSVLYHLKNYGLEVWYDNYNYILGDKKILNYKKAIQDSKYAVVIFSKSFISSAGALEELDVIKQQYLDNEIHIFPIFYQIKSDEIPPTFQWLCDLIYNELDESTGSYLTCNQIVSKYLNDYVTINNYKELLVLKSFKIPSNLIIELLDVYFNTVTSNLNCRLTTLYCIFIYIKDKIDLPPFITKTAKYLFDSNRVGLEYNFKELIIMESIICIALNIFIQKLL